MTYYFEGGTNRYVCDVLKEMRTMIKVVDGHNLERYKSMTGMMIEEIQTHVNNMEAALEDWKDLKRMREDKKKLKHEIRKLKAQHKLLKGDDDNDD